ncbi:MAG: DNA processing protein [Alphaproteobacteria bacterium]|jgi:DNA processing protein
MPALKQADDKTQHYIDIIQLIRSSNIGCINFSKALKQFGSVSRALQALADNPKIMGRSVILCSRDDAHKEYEIGIQSGARFISFNMAEFPPLLSQIYECPPFLWAKGNVALLQTDLCAIVGARNASVGGRKIAYSLAKNLGINHFTTISGLASGIDTAAHQGSLNTGTIGVLASGVNVIYPSENKTLADDILGSNGLIISEAPPNAPPQAKMFVKRNRIISGLALGTVIIEAAEKSGSLTTADFALEQNKEIFAVPGSPLDVRAAGTNQLLRNGANWAENSDDVISILQKLIQHNNIHSTTQSLKNNKQIYLHKMPSPNISVKPILIPSPSVAPSSSVTQPVKSDTTTSSHNNLNNEILSLLSTTPIGCDDLIRLTGLSSHKLLPILSMMELEGDIIRHHGNMIAKVIKKIK